MAIVHCFDDASGVDLYFCQRARCKQPLMLSWSSIYSMTNTIRIKEVDITYVIAQLAIMAELKEDQMQQQRRNGGHQVTINKILVYRKIAACSDRNIQQHWGATEKVETTGASHIWPTRTIHRRVYEQHTPPPPSQNIKFERRAFIRETLDSWGHVWVWWPRMFMLDHKH